MQSLAIRVSPDLLKKALQTNKKNYGTIKTQMLKVFTSLNREIKKINKLSEEDRATYETTLHLINSHKRPFSIIANILTDLDENAIESSVRQNGKTNYSHYPSSNYNLILKRFRNRFGTMEQLKNWADKNYGQVEWFKSTKFKKNFIEDDAQGNPQYRYEIGDKQWNSLWIKLLLSETDSEYRDNFQNRVVLEQDKQEYSKWSPLDYAKAVLSEYNSVPEPTAGGKKLAYYYTPIAAEMSQAQFIQFVKFTGKDYEDFIIKNLIDVVKQEYNRIKLVEKRRSLIDTGDKNSILNYDEYGDKFYFFPELNDMMFEVADGKSLSFLDNLRELENEPDELMDTFIEGAMKEVMNVGYNNFETWANKIGLLAKVQNTSEDNSDKIAYKYLRGEKNTIYKEDQAKALLKEFYYNNVLAQVNIQEITATDRAYFKDATNFQKRYKESMTPVNRINTKAIYKGEEVFKNKKHPELDRQETFIMLSDDYVTSSSGNNMRKAFITIAETSEDIDVIGAINLISNYFYNTKTFKTGNTKYTHYTENVYERKDGKDVLIFKKGYYKGKNSITEKQYNEVLLNTDSKEDVRFSELVDGKMISVVASEINATDGQSYRSLSSYRKVMIGASQ